MCKLFFLYAKEIWYINFKDPKFLLYFQVVGYDATATPPHYIVRNSWGSDFGDNGYLYVAIGSNLCGIAREVSTITVK